MGSAASIQRECVPRSSRLILLRVWAGLALPTTDVAFMPSQVSKAASYIEKFKDRPTDMETLVDAGYVIIGSPDEVMEQLRGSR